MFSRRRFAAFLSLLLSASACRAAGGSVPAAPQVRYRPRILQDDGGGGNDVTPSPSPAPTTPAPAPTPTPTPAPSPGGDGTPAPTPPPTDGGGGGKRGGGRAAKVAVVVMLVLALCGGLGWVGYKYRFRIADWCRNTWTSFRRYGCKGCLLFLIGRRPESGDGASLNEIIFDPDEGGTDMVRGLLS